MITFKNYKHNYNQNPFSIVLAKQLNTCPVRSFLEYFLLHGPLSGPLFINQEGLPVLRSDFCKMLCSVVQLCNLDPKKYKGHSFRIGGTTYGAEQGFSDTQIRQVGRWKSDPFKKYIRIASMDSVS